ncbi:hypothetical protein Clacol_002270 [Clathrus columnatus]|uniref:Uncharacterized protein n=1 Tax=Clathrus columnatus TaxID=1419009 RepID=A0AAV5A4D0_9AGAM|nr:hypothetical protein Clacol_002270 [Clathrus columnatus]
MAEDYTLKVPTPSSIYPRLTPDETFSVLLAANQSRPANKRFPTEILLLVIWELHPINPDFSRTLNSHRGDLRFYDSMSFADFLYRLRCFFPELVVISHGRDGEESSCSVTLQHNPSGRIWEFTDSGGGCMAWIPVQDYRPKDTEDDEERATSSMEEVKRTFIPDTIQLLNTLFGTVDGRRYIYYHPTADADRPTVDERYVAVPNTIVMDHIMDEDEALWPYTPWDPVGISTSDLSSFKSLLLPNMKYNIEHREVDPVSGTADLTTIISSSLLFYRLLCHYSWLHNNANDMAPITSVWQVRLTHRRTGVSIIFMDNRGLLDIRAEEGAEKVMDHIINLVNGLCSDKCSHPYGMVAGTVAQRDLYDT